MAKRRKHWALQKSFWDDWWRAVSFFAVLALILWLCSL